MARSPDSTPFDSIALPAVNAALAAAGFDLPGEQQRRLAAFLDGLLQANVRLNLTRITDPADAIVRHVIEPLAGWLLLRDRLPSGAVLDVGSGGGAPGLPVAIVQPDRTILLIETRERKAHYLEEQARALGLTNVRVLCDRAERVGRGPARESGAAALTRALAPLPEALEILLPLVAVDGVAAVFSGPGLPAQLDAGRGVATLLGGAPPETQRVDWPTGDRTVLLATVRKVAPTPERFPRGTRAMRRGPPQATTSRAR